MPSEPQLVELHAQMLTLLKKFHEICKEADIKYSLHGGTLLGAVREKGFIPWDDDSDITLMLSEYDKLCNVLKSRETDSNIKLVDVESNVRIILSNLGEYALLITP